MPTEKNIEQQKELTNLQLDTSELDGLEETLANASKVSEIVGESTGENGNNAKNPIKQKKDDKSFLNFSGVGNQISKILFSQNKKENILPTIEIQQKRVHKILKEESNRLIKKAEKLQKSKNFSAAKLEKLIFQIRNLQKIMLELLSAASEQIEKLYRKFFLKNN
jgi:hypothetical protein